MDLDNLAHVAAALIGQCTSSGMTMEEAMKTLIISAGMAAELETSYSNECQLASLTEAMNFALQEYKKHSDFSRNLQNAPSSGTIQ